MNNREYLAFCQKELQRSKRWRKGFEDDWRRYVALYRGEHYDYKNDVDQLTVNLIFSTINTMAPAVAINHPRFNVDARVPHDSDAASVTGEVLNYLWKTYQYQRDFRLGVLDWLIVGHGWLKAGYKQEKPPKAKKVEPELEPDASEEGIDDREDVPGNVESEMNVEDTHGRPFLERLSPFDMFVDPDARHPKEMRWIAQRVWRPIADVKADSRYSATNRARVGPSTYSRWGEDRDARSSTDKPDKGQVGFCEVIEFYDIKRGQVCTFAADASSDPDSKASGFLIKPEDMPYTFGHPFIMLRNYEVPDHFYTMGDVCQIESLQLELNETRNQMLNYRKKFRRAWLYLKDYFDQRGIDALESDEDNVAIPVSGDQNPNTVIAPMPAAITPPEFFDQSAMISMDLDRVSGISDYQRGGQNEISRTATEAAMIQDASNARAADRLQRIELILGECGRRIVELMQQFATGQQYARITTIAVKGWFPYSPQDIQGDFDFEVIGGSTEPQNETFRRQAAMQLADASAIFMQAGVVNMPNLYAKLLRDGFGVKDAERYVVAPEPPPPPEGAAPEQLTPEMLAQMKAQGQAGPPPPPPPDQIPPELVAQMQGMGPMGPMEAEGLPI